eukprot:gene10738-biopygen7608
MEVPDRMVYCESGPTTDMAFEPLPQSPTQFVAGIDTALAQAHGTSCAASGVGVALGVPEGGTNKVYRFSGHSHVPPKPVFHTSMAFGGYGLGARCKGKGILQGRKVRFTEVQNYADPSRGYVPSGLHGR